MINLKMKNSIISLYLHYGSIRNVAKILNISRNTVKKYLNENKELVEKLKETSDNSQIALLQNELLSPPKRKKSVRIKYAYTKDVEKRFNELLTIDETRNKELGKNKQNLTAAKIHRVLLDEGFNVSLTTISNKWREAKSKVKECFIIQDYEYGYRAEFDFHQIILIINGEKKTLHQATITLPKSNYIFGMLFEDEKIHSVLSSLIQFFHTCGIPKTVVFDNMSTVVKRFKSKNGKEYTDDIIKLSNYYHFKIITTNTYSGNEKGSAEVNEKGIFLN